MIRRDQLRAANVWPASTYSNDFESDDLEGFEGEWAISDDWSAEGSYSLSSGNADYNTSSETVFIFTATVSVQVSFDYCISSRTGHTFTAVLNGSTIIDGISGSKTGQYSGKWPAGVITLTLTYTRDNNRVSQLNAAFIDNLSIIAA